MSHSFGLILSHSKQVFKLENFLHGLKQVIR